MLVSMFSGLMITKKRKLVEVFPKSWRNLWDLWEIRVTVLLSLILQGILFLLGNKRKISTSNKLRIILWPAYTAAESVATVALSILSTNSGDYVYGSAADSTFMLRASWAPFLLLHLGGPDTISAYSLEDNQLWLRHLLQLVVQVLVAAYVFVSAWRFTTFNYISITMFIAGIIKSGERTWTLRQGSSNRFQDSLLRDSDPGPNYARYMEEYKSKKDEGFDVSLGKLIETHHLEVPVAVNDSDIGDAGGSNDEVDLLDHAYRFFNNFKQLFADLILSFEDVQESRELFEKDSFTHDEAFKVIEIELGFTYDLFYTKTVLRHSIPGFVLRSISSSCTVSVLLAFWVIKLEGYPEMDVIITYVLLFGAIILEIFAVFVQLSSDWTMLWLAGRVAKHYNNLNPAISSILKSRKRWSNTMGQHNLFTLCLNSKPAKCSIIQKKLSVYTFLEKYRYKETAIVEGMLKKIIFEDLKQKVKNASDLKQFCACRGGWVLGNEGCRDEIIDWSIKVEFDQSIILWHIATDICYYADFNKNPNTVNRSSNCRVSRMLSEYMLYLLVMYPFMLPNGIGQIRLRDTRDEATEFFKEASLKLNDTGRCTKLFKETSFQFDEKDACTMLSQVCTDVAPSQVKGDRCKSVLFDGCRLAKSLEPLETEKKWSLISHVWVEMLSYAACQCQWSDHAQQLRRGGELLTHVWLLMAHFGINEQLRISQGHARAKLILQ